MQMAQFTLRPEFRTAGGEVNDLEMDGIYAGTVTLTYRENDRLVGSVQLDKSMITKEEKKEVALWADEYVHSLADALHVEECEVLVTYSKIDHIISSFEEVADDDIDVDLFDGTFKDKDDDSSLDDIIDPNDRDEYTMYDDEEVKPIR